MDEKRLHVLQHALGLDQYGRGDAYRNHFVTGPGSTNYPHCTAMVQQGLMRQQAGGPITGGHDIFIVTSAGRAAVVEHSPPAPKLTRAKQRYRDYLAADSRHTFLEWLRMKR